MVEGYYASTIFSKASSKTVYKSWEHAVIQPNKKLLSLSAAAWSITTIEVALRTGNGTQANNG